MLYVLPFTETTAEVLERYAAQQEKLGPVINPDSFSTTCTGGGDNLSTATTGGDNSTTTSTAATNATTSAAEKPNVTSSAVGESADSKTATKPVATTAAAV